MGEKKSMYLSRRDFSRHGFTDGCVGCRAIASGVQGRTGIAHSRECRKRLEGIVQKQEPERWARHVRKHREQAADGEADLGLGAQAGSGSGPAAGDQTGDVPPRAREEDEVLFGDDSDEDDRQSHPAFSEDERIDSESRAGMVAVQNQRRAKR